MPTRTKGSGMDPFSMIASKFSRAVSVNETGELFDILKRLRA